MRTLFATSLVMFAVGTLVALADERGAANPRAQAAGQPAPGGADRGNRADRVEKSDAEREAAALAFVPRKPPRARRSARTAQGDEARSVPARSTSFWQVSRSLANFKKNEGRRYQPALDVWKARSRAELLAAQLASTPDSALEGQLRAALTTQLDAEVRQQKVERELAKERLHKLDESIDRLESRRDKLVESRYQIMLRKGQRAHTAGCGSSDLLPAGDREGREPGMIRSFTALGAALVLVSTAPPTPGRGADLIPPAMEAL